jgi:hypothetical protein
MNHCPFCGYICSSRQYRRNIERKHTTLIQGVELKKLLEKKLTKQEESSSSSFLIHVLVQKWPIHLNDLIVLVFEYLLYNSLLGFQDPFHPINPYVFGDLKWVVGLVKALKPTLNLLLKRDPNKDN